jgi:hypothetical protein
MSTYSYVKYYDMSKIAYLFTNYSYYDKYYSMSASMSEKRQINMICMVYVLVIICRCYTC